MSTLNAILLFAVIVICVVVTLSFIMLGDDNDEE